MANKVVELFRSIVENGKKLMKKVKVNAAEEMIKVDNERVPLSTLISTFENAKADEEKEKADEVEDPETGKKYKLSELAETYKAAKAKNASECTCEPKPKDGEDHKENCPMFKKNEAPAETPEEKKAREEKEKEQKENSKKKPSHFAGLNNRMINGRQDASEDLGKEVAEKVKAVTREEKLANGKNRYGSHRLKKE